MTTHCGVCSAHYTDPCNILVHSREARIVELEGYLRRMHENPATPRDVRAACERALGMAPPPTADGLGEDER